uniref:Aldehyde dehydrogenase 22A1 n=1 Tax=Lygus hesperus TaxID=30085 RepID=A0A0A9WGT9_LYGHE
MTMGKNAIDKVSKLIERSVAAGATLLCGGSAIRKLQNGSRSHVPGECHATVTEDNEDCFFQPAILTNVTPEMPIAQEEVFGPVMVIMKFSYDTEAIRIVNACPYGLGASVFSGNASRAQYIADRLQTGMVNINDFGINYLCQSLPFGGMKISGFDRFAGREGLRGNCVVRAMTRDRIPGVKTVIPAVLEYPIGHKAFRFM